MRQVADPPPARVVCLLSVLQRVVQRARTAHAPAWLLQSTWPCITTTYLDILLGGQPYKVLHIRA
jgi:hypothetical protein